MALKENHKGIDELTNEEAEDIARQLFERECERARENETPPEYVGADSSPVAARILNDLDDDIVEVLGDAD